jgi:hypothetical protein
VLRFVAGKSQPRDETLDKLYAFVWRRLQMPLPVLLALNPTGADPAADAGRSPDGASSTSPDGALVR